MGAGQIGGMATLLDIDFSNSAGFEGTNALLNDGHFIVYFLSHAMVFCLGAIIEAHVILTPASCVFGERYKFDVFAGTHTFLENFGFGRKVNHVCFHRGYNHTQRWESCYTDNMALLVVAHAYQFDAREKYAQFPVSRLRYGLYPQNKGTANCKYYGWGSRRNGFLMPLLIQLREVQVRLLDSKDCDKLWNHDDKYVCLTSPMCKSSKHGALCPDDVGTMLVCDGYLHGMMTSRLIDRPCGVGFLNMDKYVKFLTCGVDESREVLSHEEGLEFFNADVYALTTPHLLTLPDEGAYITEVTIQEEPTSVAPADDNKDDDSKR